MKLRILSGEEEEIVVKIGFWEYFLKFHLLGVFVIFLFFFLLGFLYGLGGI